MINVPRPPAVLVLLWGTIGCSVRTQQTTGTADTLRVENTKLNLLTLAPKIVRAPRK